MKRLLVIGLAALVGSLLLGVRPAAAQYVPALIQQPPTYGVGQQTLLPPALNLLRNGGVVPTFTGGVQNFIPGVDPALNYFLGEVTETRRRELAYQQQAEILDLRQAVRQGVAEQEDIDELLRPLRSTGHPAVFNNLGGYYNTTRVGTRSLYQVQRRMYQAQPPRVR